MNFLDTTTKKKLSTIVYKGTYSTSTEDGKISLVIDIIGVVSSCCNTSDFNLMKLTLNLHRGKTYSLCQVFDGTVVFLSRYRFDTDCEVFFSV